MGNNNPSGYSASSQILTGYSASDTFNNEKCLHPCNMDLKYSSKKCLCEVSVIYFKKCRQVPEIKLSILYIYIYIYIYI